jgi:hypothetical protein
MGMFDYLVCDDPLPVPGFEKTRFQTNSVGRSWMRLYKIKKGQLYEQPSFDPESSLDEEMWHKTLNEPGEPQDHTGVVYFYHYFDAPIKGRVEFVGMFEHGRLVKPIGLIEHHVEETRTAGSITYDDIVKAEKEIKTYADTDTARKLYKSFQEMILKHDGLIPLEAKDYEPYILKELNTIPLGALKAFVEGAEEDVSTAIARHPKHGYAVIQTAGQGPMLVWQPGQALAKASAEYIRRKMQEPPLSRQILAMSNEASAPSEPVTRFPSDPLPDHVLAKLKEDAHLYGNAYAVFSDGKWQHINPRDILVVKGDKKPTFAIGKDTVSRPHCAWFKGFCSACGYPVVVTPASDYHWSCANTKCPNHAGEETDDQSEPSWWKYE